MSGLRSALVGVYQTDVRGMAIAFIAGVSSGISRCSRRVSGAYTARVPDARRTSMLSSVLLVILILMLLGALPAWPHSRSWGYGPTGGLGLLLVILLVLVFMERI